MSAKKLGSNKIPNQKELEIKHKMFEKLSQKGFLQSLQQQMRSAIAQELNDSIQPSNANEIQINDKQIENIYEKDSDPLEKVSAIANWEKQIRYELEIDREIQSRELDRQRERLKTETRKLEEKDKCLRIELDARERKLRLREEELIISNEDLNHKINEISTKEQTIDSIVSEKIKCEMKDEIERIRKKFNELEEKEVTLNRREDKVKEVEQRLHEQVKIVKEKIDNKRLSEIELAKSRKDLEIIRKENEVLKQRIETMEDYHLTKFENKSLKNELNSIKETLKNKITEFEFEREKLETIIKQNDEKILNSKMDVRKKDQELLLLKQKHQGDIDQYSNKLEQLKNRLEESKLVIQRLQQKNHLLSKQIISAQNMSQKINESNEILNNNMTKMGCHICDHNIKTLEESSLDFLISQKFSDSKTKLVDEHNKELNNPSISCDNREKNGLKEDKQNSVPSKITDANNRDNNSAKYVRNDIQFKRSNADNEKLNDKEYITKSGHNLHLNGINRHKIETNDNEKDMFDSFEW